MNFINAVISGFGVTVGAILSLIFIALAGAFISLLYYEVQARLLVKKVEKEIKRKEKENEREVYKGTVANNKHKLGI